MRGVIYARYSSDNQREESIEGQIRENTAFADKNGIEIVGTYIDRAYSAKTDNRPDFQKMIKDSAGKAFDVVIVWKLDRFINEPCVRTVCALCPQLKRSRMDRMAYSLNPCLKVWLNIILQNLQRRRFAV